jgi:hypothetical protein
MSIFSKLFGKKQTEGEDTSRIGGMEDFMTLIRVYYQSVMACNIGITNINFLPDMAVFPHKRNDGHTEFPLHQITYQHHQVIAESLEHKKISLDIIYILAILFYRTVNFFKEIIT